MEQLYFETYKGKQILIEDFTHLKPGPEFLQRIAQAQALIASQPAKSVLAVFDATGSSYNNENLSAMKAFTKANTPYVKAAAVVGISGLLEVAMAAIAKFSGRSFISFKTRAEALEWLAQQ